MPSSPLQPPPDRKDLRIQAVDRCVRPTATALHRHAPAAALTGFPAAQAQVAPGKFVGSAEGRALSAASAFSGRPVPVVVRFSVGGGNPKAPDNARSQRNLALQFDPPDVERWQMGNITAPVFGAATPEQCLGRPAPASGSSSPWAARQP